MRERLMSVQSMMQSGQSSSIAELTAVTVMSGRSWKTTRDAKLGSDFLSGEKIEKSPSWVGHMPERKGVRT
jgi:hypothetical protein